MEADQTQVIGNETLFLERGFVLAHVFRKADTKTRSEMQELYWW